MQEFRCKIYKDYKISIPSKIRKLLAIKPQDEIIIRVDNNKMIIESLHNELTAIQKDVKRFFKNKSIVEDFLKCKGKDYDD